MKRKKHHFLYAFAGIFTFALLSCNQPKQDETQSNKEEPPSLAAAEVKSAELIKEWETDPVLNIPESVLHDPETGIVYVANIQGEPTGKDGKGFISKMTPSGDITRMEWVSGIDAPKGMGIYDGKLYVTNIDELVEIDIESASVSNTYPLEGAQFANDISINNKGVVFISDMSNGGIYKFENGTTSIWIEPGTFESPNGLFADKDFLYIGTNDIVMQANYQTAEFNEYIKGTGSIDGLEKFGDGYFVISDWQGRIHLIHPEKEKILLLDTTPQEINAADIWFDPDSNRVYVPTFFDNRVVAYKLNVS